MPSFLSVLSVQEQPDRQLKHSTPFALREATWDPWMPMNSQKTSQNSDSLMLLVNTAEDGERTGLLFLKDALRV